MTKQNRQIAITKSVISVSVGILLISACGGYSSRTTTRPSWPPDMPPRIRNLRPNAVRAGIEKQTITIEGGGFNKDCRVTLDGEEVRTTYVDGGMLFANLNKTHLEKPRVAEIQARCSLLSNSVGLNIR